MTGTSYWKTWIPDIGAGLLVMCLGVLEVFDTAAINGAARAPYPYLVAGVAASVALARRLPLAALILVWALAGAQVASGASIMLVEFSVVVVAFGCARWGHPVTVALGGLSIPAAGAASLLLVMAGGRPVGPLVDTVSRLDHTWQVAVAVLGGVVLANSWLAGLALRYAARASASKVSQARAEDEAVRAVRDRKLAEEIARLREEQARLACDVHDVVGHSLAVILAQAESGQYLADADARGLKNTMATIATFARTSLQDVRQVLTTPERTVPGRVGGFESLLDGVRDSGHDVVSTETGAPQPLPPELETVAYRVLQEMLTNAIRHGRRDTPILVEQRWEGELRIEVRNVPARTDEETGPRSALDPGAPAAGQGLGGMRRRLESVGGRLDVRRREESDGPTFIATAWVPVRTVLA
jgi:signal transduction histidine kinase